MTFAGGELLWLKNRRDLAASGSGLIANVSPVLMLQGYR